MPEPKVFVFAPADTDSLQELESAGCSLTLGSANWSDPTGDSTERLAEMASGADALAGTSIKGAKDLPRRALGVRGAAHRLKVHRRRGRD